MRAIPATLRDNPPERRVIPSRVALVALGLVPAGAAAGALAGALGAMIWLTAAEGLHPAPIPFFLGVAGIFGGMLGAVILPVAGFTLLRYVPLGRALAETIVATAVGGAIGMQFLGVWWLAGPLAGFGVAATRLWALARQTRRRQYAALELEP
jgi:hypothetical protein